MINNFVNYLRERESLVEVYMGRLRSRVLQFLSEGRKNSCSLIKVFLGESWDSAFPVFFLMKPFSLSCVKIQGIGYKF